MFTDRLTLDAKPRITSEGYLVADARVARSGIQEYLRQELPTAPKDAPGVVRLYRPAEEVFGDAMKTFAHRPMTNDHPAEPVTSKNWHELAIGYTGDTVARDGEFIRVPLTMTDQSAIDAYNAGKRELSMGYEADIDWTAGVTDSGEKYDGIMRNIRNNHIALVDAARAGHGARIGDKGGQHKQPNNHDGDHMDTVKMVVDGLTIETTEQGKQAIDKVTKQLADAQGEAKTYSDAKEKELAAKDAEIDKLKKQVMDAAALDKAIMERAELITTASKIADVDYKGKAPAEIRKAAVKARLGDAAIAGKSEAYIDARFDILAESLNDAIAGTGNVVNISDAEAAAKAHKAWVDKIYNGGVAVTKEA